ncbi:MAG: hypothetical protein F6J87_28025 [Spirulina sp. SIO3F2]|nr:hypothetical protein [Spirulina sp. SIO3F2]
MKEKYYLGFISQSHMVNEMRSPIWHKHLPVYTPDHPVIKEYIFEQSFGSHTFKGAADNQLKQLGYKVKSRLELLSLCDIVISLKPTDEWKYMQPNSTLVGWFNHLNHPLNESRNINFLDLENIRIFDDGRYQKLLYKNAYVAGRCGVSQTLDKLSEFEPSSPAITQRKLAVVLGYGNIGKGAARELLRQGIEKVIVFTQRPPTEVSDKLDLIEYRQMQYSNDDIYEISDQGLKQPLIDCILREADIIVNAKIPSNDCPKWRFVPENKFFQLKSNMAFIDPIHRKGHGADFVEVTSFGEPLKKICKATHSIWFNGCNSMPNYQADYASYVISEALLKNFDTIVEAAAKK